MPVSVNVQGVAKETGEAAVEDLLQRIERQGRGLNESPSNISLRSLADSPDKRDYRVVGKFGSPDALLGANPIWFGTLARRRKY
jgi:hypothetical protein